MHQWPATVYSVHSDVLRSYDGKRNASLLVFDNHIDLGCLAQQEFDTVKFDASPPFVNSGNILTCLLLRTQFRRIVVVLPPYLKPREEELLSRLGASLVPMGAVVSPRQIRLLGQVVEYCWGDEHIPIDDATHIEVDCDYFYSYKDRRLWRDFRDFFSDRRFGRLAGCSIIRSCADGYLPAKYFTLGDQLASQIAPLRGGHPSSVLGPAPRTVPRTLDDLSIDFQFLKRAGEIECGENVDLNSSIRFFEYYLSLYLSGAIPLVIDPIAFFSKSVMSSGLDLLVRFLIREARLAECISVCRSQAALTERASLSYLYSVVSSEAASERSILDAVSFCDERQGQHGPRYNRMALKLLTIMNRKDMAAARLQLNRIYYPNDSEFH